MNRAEDLIDRLGLVPHPEGGWYRETWRADAAPGTRAAATLIHFLLTSEQRSHWHAVDADEIWLWAAGDPLELAITKGECVPISRVRLGPDPLAGDALQVVVPRDHWQAARPLSDIHGYVLVSCVVAPGFEFSGFRLAAPDWQPCA